MTNMANTTAISSGYGRDFTLKIIKAGERYGLTGKLIADADMVEFYDQTHMFTPYGQFVSRYYVDTLLGRDGLGGATGGLILDGGVEAWRISPEGMAQVREWVGEQCPAMTTIKLEDLAQEILAYLAPREGE